VIPDDDAVRRALLRDLPRSEAGSVLHSLRPAMRRQRAQRRAAIATAAALVVIGGGAGALAVGGSLQNQTSVSDRSATTQVLGTLEPVETDSVSTDTPIPETVAAPPVVAPPDDRTESSEATTTVPPVVVAPPVTNAPMAPPPAPVLPPASTATPAIASTTTATPATRLERVESECGVLIVAVSGNVISVSDLQPASGFSSNVTDGGPTSIELKFVSASRTCEVHVEMKSGALAVEVQHDS
jgi:hypothetical protein